LDAKDGQMGATEMEASLELVYLALNQVRKATLAQVEQVQASWNLEVLRYCDFYDMCGYDKYVLLDFEIVLNSLAAGRDMQISEDDSGDSFSWRFDG
jgi:hypothetical protein